VTDFGTLDEFCFIGFSSVALKPEDVISLYLQALQKEKKSGKG